MSSSSTAKPNLWKRLRNRVKHGKQTALNGTEISRISLEKFIRDRKILDEIKEKEVIVTKKELFWLMDNVHSNEVIIRKLEKRCQMYEKMPTLEEQALNIEKLQTEKKLLMAHIAQRSTACDLLEATIEKREKEYRAVVQELSSGKREDAIKYQAEIEHLRAENSGLKVVLSENMAAREEMIERYEKIICEIEMDHTRALLKIGEGTRYMPELSLKDKENISFKNNK